MCVMRCGHELDSIRGDTIGKVLAAVVDDGMDDGMDGGGHDQQLLLLDFMHEG